MKKDEVLALGVPEEKYREFQQVYNTELNKAANKKRMEKDADWETRSAIHAMLKLIKRQETLNSILQYINVAYYREV